ncbi:cyanophycin synthetase [Massilia dura]|uniref:Cyanophycin synthetase n=1 Tax=Pseudoduganella dura TaxID=321982 RepID=A0A6I3XS93_9BURK|nr:cyanophycin synthetase [Pseudoduganella dura]MUI16182.1 cyanophycin synthetase [Pseudoduganella dura]GGY19206.1 cyanophycin synthetase [Pseudoduganella dura]
MNILDQRVLRGPNLYAARPCLLTVLDLETLHGVASSDVPGFTDALLALVPGLHAHRCSPGHQGGFAERLRDGTYMGHVVEHLTLELQCLAGTPAGFGRTRRVRGQPGVYRVVCAYRVEAVVVEAFDLALAIVVALARGEAFALDEPLAALRLTAERNAIGTSTAAVLKAARGRRIPYFRVSDNANLFQLGWGSRQKRLQATMTGDASNIACRIASDKQLTKALLKEAGVPVPGGSVVTSTDEAQRAARRLRGIVTVKPLDANQGKGVTTQCTTPKQVAAAFDAARKFSRSVIVERFIEGNDYRVLVTGDTVAAASLRRPPTVVGDGRHTIRELVAAENRNPARGQGHTNILTQIPLDEHALQALEKRGYGLDSVPPAGVPVTLRGNANLSTGGTAEDVTDLLPDETRAICVRAAQKIGLDVAGIDLVCRDIARPLADQGGAIIEVNAAPGIRMHQYPAAGTPRDAGDAIVEAMYGDDDGRIPVIAVTGTNGKTTTTLMAAHCVRMAGLRTGVTTTEGIYVDGRQIASGDCSGYWSARTVLTDPTVDFAILETARGGILKRGLAFDRCDVAVMLNISADHLGLDGVDTVEELARVKGVVAGAASRCVVLNAEDRHCVRLGGRLKDTVEVLYFALDPDNPVLLKHLHNGGRGAYLQDSQLVVADGTRHQVLLRAADMPSTLGGHARYNIANGLAAAAALLATGFTVEQIAAGLASFVSDGRTNPLRSNVFDVRGITVVVDYAHNPAAYNAMSGMARGLSKGRVVGVITAPGDRRDQDLEAVGETCARGFDEIVVYEAGNRGRPTGECAQLMLAGAQRSGKPRDVLHSRLAGQEALRHGLSLCKPGDVMVFACGSSLNEVVEALRDSDPASARQIAAQAALVMV